MDRRSKVYQGKDDGVSYGVSLMGIDKPCCKKKTYYGLGWYEAPSKRTRLEEERCEGTHLHQECGDTCHQLGQGAPPSF